MGIFVSWALAIDLHDFSYNLQSYILNEKNNNKMLIYSSSREKWDDLIFVSVTDPNMQIASRFQLGGAWLDGLKLAPPTSLCITRLFI